jgi:hypothetical protein
VRRRRHVAPRCSSSSIRLRRGLSQGRESQRQQKNFGDELTKRMNGQRNAPNGNLLRFLSSTTHVPSFHYNLAAFAAQQTFKLNRYFGSGALPWTAKSPSDFSCVSNGCAEPSGNRERQDVGSAAPSPPVGRSSPQVSFGSPGHVREQQRAAWNPNMPGCSAAPSEPRQRSRTYSTTDVGSGVDLRRFSASS